MKFLIKKSPDGFIKSVNDEIASILNRNFDSFFPEYIYNEDLGCEDKYAMPVELHEKDNEYSVKQSFRGLKKKIWTLILIKITLLLMPRRKKSTKKTQKGSENPNLSTANFQEPFISRKKLMSILRLQNWNTESCA